MQGHRIASELKRRRRASRHRAARRLGLEPLEPRYLATNDLWAENPSVQDVRYPTPIDRLEIVFDQPMAVAPMISDGSIYSAVSLRNLRRGPASLAQGQFRYDESTRTLAWTSSHNLPSGYSYELRLETSAFRGANGNMLRGGTAGLDYQPPTFAAEQFVQAAGSPIDVGDYSVPAVVDWNRDGRDDLIVGEKTAQGTGKVRVYLNSGTTGAPTFGTFFYAQQGTTDISVPAAGCLGAFPHLFDWDGDGKRDLIVGLADGKIQLYPNVAADNDPRFGAPSQVMMGEPGSKVPFDGGDRATVDIVDWNNDGKRDLVVGTLDGKVRVLVNRSESWPPDFRSELMVNDGGGPLAVPGGRASVVVVDLDGDRRKDLLLGNTLGQLFFYPNVGTDAAPSFDGSLPIAAAGVVIDLPDSPRSRPAVADVNADGIPDLLLGAQDGLLRVYTAVSWPTRVDQPRRLGDPGSQYSFRFETAGTVWQNPLEPCDVNDDGDIIPRDVLAVVNELNHPTVQDANGKLELPPPPGARPPYFDVSGDGYCTPRDALIVINLLNSAQQPGEAEGEMSAASQQLVWIPPASRPQAEIVRQDEAPVRAAPQTATDAAPAFPVRIDARSPCKGADAPRRISVDHSPSATDLTLSLFADER